MATTTLTQGIEAYQNIITFGDGIDITGTGTFSDSITGTGLLHSFGTRKIQTFVGTLAATDTGTAYGDGDVLVELGTLDTSAPSGVVTASKFYIHRALVGITTAAGQTLIGGLTTVTLQVCIISLIQMSMQLLQANICMHLQLLLLMLMLLQVVLLLS